MKMKQIILGALLALTCVGCGRSIRTAEDITPGNIRGEKMDWRYGAADIRVQTTKLTKVLMDRWYHETGYDCSYNKKPRIVITEVDNRTDMYISTDMIRDIFEGVAVNDGRFVISVGDARDERELDKVRNKVNNNPKYGRITAEEYNQQDNSVVVKVQDRAITTPYGGVVAETRGQVIVNQPKVRDPGTVKIPELLAKVRITKAVNSDARYDYEDYRMTVTLYDLETQEIVDSAWDVLRKKVRA